MRTPKGTELLPYQCDGVRMLRNFNGRALLGDDPGLGKTIQSYYYCFKYIPDDPPGPIVIVCPGHAKLVWKNELLRHFGIRADVLYHQRVPTDRQSPWNPNATLIVNYDILIPPHRGKTGGWRQGELVPEDSWLYYLRKLTPRMLIIDEGQYCSNPLSVRTRACRVLSRNSSRLIIATGTPMDNNPMSLWALLSMILPNEFSSYHEFGTQYTNAQEIKGEWVYRGAKDLDLLNVRLKRTCLIRRRKKDVLKDLPEIVTEVVPIEVDLSEYRTTEQAFLKWLDNAYSTTAASERKAKALNKLGFLARLAAKLKLKSGGLNWVEDFLASGNKLIAGVCHYAISDSLMQKFGDRAILVDGRLTDKEKHSRFEQFNANPDIPLLVGNLDSAGTAWSCRSASDAVALELPYKPSQLSQFAARCHGLGRGIEGRGTMMYLLIAVGTVEEDRTLMLQRKADWAAAAIDGGAAPDFDLDELIERMRERNRER